MSSLLLDPPFDAQPQEAVEVDWGNPLAAGLHEAFLGGDSALRGRVRAVGPVSPRISPTGRGVGFGSAAYIALDGSPTILTGRFTCLFGLRYSGQTSGREYVSHGGASGGGGWFIRGAAQAIGLTYAAVADYTGMTRNMVADQLNVVGVTVDGLGGTCTYYLDGTPAGTVAVGTPSLNAATRDMIVGGRYAGAVQQSGNIAAGDTIEWVIVWARPLSADEISAVSANPWQLFRPSRPITYVPRGTSGGETGDASGTLTLGVSSTAESRATASATGTLALGVAAIAEARTTADAVGTLTVGLTATGSSTNSGTMNGTLSLGLTSVAQARTTAAAAARFVLGLVASGTQAVGPLFSGYLNGVLTTMARYRGEVFVGTRASADLAMIAAHHAAITTATGEDGALTSLSGES